MVAFDRCFVIARDLPTHLARLFVKRGDPGLAFVHPSHDDITLGQHGGCTVVPEQRIRTETLDQVGAPPHRTIQRSSTQRLGAVAQVDIRLRRHAATTQTLFHAPRQRQQKKCLQLL